MRTRLIFAALFALICLPLLMVSADAVLLETLSGQTLLLKYSPADNVRAIEVEWPLPADAEGKNRKNALRAGLRIPAPTDAEAAAGTDPWIESTSNTTFRILLPNPAPNPNIFEIYWVVFFILHRFVQIRKDNYSLSS